MIKTGKNELLPDRNPKAPPMTRSTANEYVQGAHAIATPDRITAILLIFVLARLSFLVNACDRAPKKNLPTTAAIPNSDITHAASLGVKPVDKIQ